MFAVLLLAVVLDFAINAGDRLDSANGWEIHFEENPATVPGIGLSYGFIIHPSGHVLTDGHVTEHTEQIMIMTSDDLNYGLAVVACDHACEMELLRIKTPNGQEYRALPIVNPDVVKTTSIDYSVASCWVRELLDELRSDKWELEDAEY
jgi:hypothetical protein